MDIRRSILAASIFALTTLPAFADTVSISFEASGNPEATRGAEATNLYVSDGVRFPSRPTITRNGSSQVLQQGTTGNNPDPLPDRVACSPLEIEFNPDNGVREIRMRIINRHLRDYNVRAFSNGNEVDQFEFRATSSGNLPVPPIVLQRDVVLRAANGSGEITRVVVTPPTDCFDLAVIDNFEFETENPVTPISPLADEPRPNIFTVQAYEVTQGVMSRLTRPDGAGPTIPDTRLMALPSKQLVFVEGRDTALRFFISASERDDDFDASLRVTTFYRDGSVRRNAITENTAGGSRALLPDTGLSPTESRQLLAQRRSRVDQSLDFVIPGRFLRGAVAMQARLATMEGRRLSRVRVNFEGPYNVGLNVWRINGVGTAAAIGAAPVRGVTRLLTQFIEDIYPISGIVSVRERGVLTVGDTANPVVSTTCRSLLLGLNGLVAGTAAAAAIPGTNYWSNLYISSSPGCGGEGVYSGPGALTRAFVNTTADGTSTAHEIGHNIGLNHATRLHGEPTDRESWPYLHGSIGAIDQPQGFDDGVFGVVMTPDAPGLNLEEDWGTWQLTVLPPCRGQTVNLLFPSCTEPDTNITHDLMSYSPRTDTGVWGQQRWISDINYYRIQRFFQDCIALDPQNRFFGSSPEPSSTPQLDNGTCIQSISGQPATGASSEKARATPKSALVISGLIEKKVKLNVVRIIRKLATPESFYRPAGPYGLVVRSGDGSVLHSTFFATQKTSGGASDAETFAVVVPYQPKLASIEILYQKERIFTEKLSDSRPEVRISSPKDGDVWRKGTKRIAWKLRNTGKAAEYYVQYSPDNGASWLPLGLVGGARNFIDVDVQNLVPSKNALIYVSVANGLGTASDVLVKGFAIAPK